MSETQTKKTIQQGTKLQIVKCEFNGQELNAVKASLGDAIRDNVIDLASFNYALVLPDEALGASEIKLELTIKPVAGPR